MFGQNPNLLFPELLRVENGELTWTSCCVQHVLKRRMMIINRFLYSVKSIRNVRENMIYKERESRCWRCDAPLRNGRCTFKCEEIVRLQLSALIKKWEQEDKKDVNPLPVQEITNRGVKATSRRPFPLP